MVQIGEQTGEPVGTTTTSSSWTTPNGGCSSRLPCGVCIILGKMCPKEGYTITPTWNEVTCR